MKSPLFVVLPVVGFLLSSPAPVHTQCSDGGVCTLSPGQATDFHRISADASFGKSGGDENITYTSFRLLPSLALFPGSRLNLVIPFSRQSGPLGGATGIGDVMLVWVQELSADPENEVELQGGLRLATADENAGSLPQRYQSGLGTNDILLGAGWVNGHWQAGAGFQIPLGRSANSVDRLKRGPDLMLRAGYTFEHERLRITGELIGIKRLGLSSVQDTTTTDERFVDLPGSDQTQINVVLTPSLRLSEHLSLRAAVAVPLLKREINVDGLTRAFTAVLGVEFSL